MRAFKNTLFVLGVFCSIFIPVQHLKAAEINPTASFLGTHSYERVGYHLHTAGDVNHDGYDDLLIGTFHNREEGYNSGAAYLILGRSQADWGFGNSLRSADARFIGKHAYDAVGYCLAGSGDLNGDGYDDIVIGAPAGDDQIVENPGHVYVVFGKSNINWGYDYNLPDNADASFDGEGKQNLAGLSVAILGDLNDDGYDDFLVGAPYNDRNKENSGKAYLILGKPNGWQRGVNLSGATASFAGSSRNGLLGYAVDGLGDVNGDDIPDFGFGERGTGSVYIFFGHREADWGQNVSVSQADVRLGNEEYKDWAGWRVSRAGDVNDDGLDDILVGAPLNNDGGRDAGKVYLILGRRSGWPSGLSDADASFIGEDSGDQAGWDVQDAGDVDSDGFDDFLIGAWYNDENGHDSGKMYVIKGRSSGWQRNVSLSKVGIYFAGEHSGDFAGFSVATPGDMNGDGTNDMVTSSTYNEDAYTWGGKIQLFISDRPVPELLVQPLSLDFSNDLTQLSFTVQNDGAGTLTWKANADAQSDWISSISPDSGSLEARESVLILVEVNRTGLTDGHYPGNIIINSNDGAQEVAVQMDVGTPPPVISVSPEELNFSAVEGDSNPAELSITITNAGADTLMWTASEEPDAAWLNLSNTTGGGGDTLRVSVDVLGLEIGAYEAVIRISDANAENNPVDIPVTLKITPSLDGLILAEFQAEESSSLPNSAWEITRNEGQKCIEAIATSFTRPNGSYELKYYFSVPENVSEIYVFAEVDVNGDSDNDSFWLTLNGSDKCIWNGLHGLGNGWKRQWVFNRGSDLKHAFAVSPGSHTLGLSPRENGGYVNWLVVTTDPDLDIDTYEFQSGLAKNGAGDEALSNSLVPDRPLEFRLFQNYPNPFNPTARIQFEIPEEGRVKLTIYNTLGQVVRDLMDEYRPAGCGSMLWDARNNTGDPVRSGVYFCRLTCGSQNRLIKMSLVK